MAWHREITGACFRPFFKHMPECILRQLETTGTMSDVLVWFFTLSSADNNTRRFWPRGQAGGTLRLQISLQKN